MLLRLAFFTLFCLLPPLLHAAEPEVILDTAERYVRLQTKGQAGTVRITVGKPDVSRLPPCTAHEAFSPPGTQLIGQTHIGVRCLGPNIWSILVPVQISITGDYLTTSRPLAAGQVISANDLTVVSGDLAKQPTGIVTDPQAAIGKTLRNSLAAGQPLRSHQLLAPLVIRQGQTVRVISQGSGFAVSGEGRAINNASAGQLTQVRMNSGQTISGIARADGSVEVSF